MKKRTIILIILIILLAAVPVCADDVNNQSSNISIEQNQTYEKDIAGAFNSIDIDGIVEGNVIAISTKSTQIAGNVDGIFINAANTMVLSGNFEKDVVAFSTFMTVSDAEICDDLIAVSAYSFESDSNTIFNDDVYIYSAENVILRGRVKGDAVIKANNVIIDAVIDNNVSIYSDNIQLSQNAKIAGNLNYTSSLNASIDESASIDGNMNHIIIPSKNTQGGLSIVSVGMALFKILFLVFLAWIFIKAGPRFMSDSLNILRTKPASSFFTGLGILIGSAILSILMIIFILLIVPGVFLLGVYLFLSLISIIPLAILISERIGSFGKNSIMGIFLSICIITILTYVPYIGFIVSLIITCMGAGCIYKAFISRLKHKNTAGM